MGLPGPVLLFCPALGLCLVKLCPTQCAHCWPEGIPLAGCQGGRRYQWCRFAQLLPPAQPLAAGALVVCPASCTLSCCCLHPANCACWDTPVPSQPAPLPLPEGPGQDRLAMIPVWSRGGYQQAPVTATAHVPPAQGCFNSSPCWPASAACREAPWDRLPELSVARGRLPGQVAPQLAAWPSLSGMGQLAAPSVSPAQFSTAQASCAGCRVPADQVWGHCGAEDKGKPCR